MRTKKPDTSPVFSSVDKRWKNSYVVSVGIASASKVFLESLKIDIGSRLGTGGSISHGARVPQLRFGLQIHKILMAMFYDAPLLHLPRKFAKAQKILRIH